MNRKVEYALMALKLISEKGPHSRTSAKEVSDALNLPFDATAKVMQLMAMNRLLKSEQGASGGYVLQKNLEQVNLLELVEMIEGRQGLVKCSHGAGATCDIQESCNISEPLIGLSEKFNEFYRGITLKEALHV